MVLRRGRESALSRPARQGAASRRAWLTGVAAAGASACIGGCARRGEAPPGRAPATLWFTYGGRNRATLEQLVRRFNEEQSAHWIRAVFQGDYFEGLAKLRAAIAARAAPALSHVVGEVIPYLSEAGALAPLGELPGARELDVVEALGQAGAWRGGAARPLVALPFNRSTPIAYVNQAIFDEQRLRPPATWAELRETARALTRREGGRTLRYGFGCPVDWWFWVALVGQGGGEVIEPDGRVTLGGDAGVRALELWQRMVTEDASMKPPPGRDYNAWEATNQDFLAGRTAMIWTSTAFLRYLEDNASFPVTAAPLPGEVRRAVPTGGTHWILPARGPAGERDAAWAFLRWLHQPAQAAEWATRTGYIPVTRGAIARLEAEGFYAAHPNDQVALRQLDVALPWPWAPALFRVQREIVQPRLERAVLAGGDAHALLDEARRHAARELG